MPKKGLGSVFGGLSVQASSDLILSFLSGALAEVLICFTHVVQSPLARKK